MYRYRAYPTDEQASFLRRLFGCVRVVYNRGLQERKDAWSTDQKTLSRYDQSKSLTQWKKGELTFLNEVPNCPLQQALRNLDKAFKLFWAKKSCYPIFKKKKYGGSATFTRATFKLSAMGVKFMRIDDPVRIQWSRAIPDGAIPSTATISLDSANRWHISIMCDDATIKPLEKLETSVGVDLGLTSLATFSSGEKIPNPRWAAREAKRLATLARRFSRKKAGSKNRNKARIMLAKLHARVGDRRKDFLHKLSTRLVRENQVIAVETLNIRGMKKNRMLARAVSDAGWSTFGLFLQYKCEWYGRTFVKIDRFYPSSKTCSSCGHVVERLPLNIREWECPACKTKHDRDINAARNILTAGLAVSVCGPDVRRGSLNGSSAIGVEAEKIGRKANRNANAV